jgi:hypothetical protein
MNPAANSCLQPKSAVWSLALDSVRQIFRPFGPFSPATPISPPTGPATGSSNGLHRVSNFLAMMPVSVRLGGCFSDEAEAC